jgi:hypothetical protein
MEHRAGIEPANTGFADQRVSHFATGALFLAFDHGRGGNTKPASACMAGRVETSSGRRDQLWRQFRAQLQQQHVSGRNRDPLSIASIVKFLVFKG